ncbi:hypothetical protein ACIHDR_43515 [Nocardia sp. NPDC052278]|uniref:hypothetical protein n=1 Tax=unclassified Nocardia TaxID=2637762 RepID=UPI0036ADF998
MEAFCLRDPDTIGGRIMVAVIGGVISGLIMWGVTEVAHHGEVPKHGDTVEVGRQKLRLVV